MTELLRKLTKYAEADIYPFHMPGHKRNVSSTYLANTPLAALYGIDLTEISDFDNLHHAEGLLKRAQERVAEIYGSKRTHFLINGSTSGILSAVSAVAEIARHRAASDGRNTKSGGHKPVLLIGRNCHRSVYHAAFLNRLELRYLYPEFDAKFQIWRELTPRTLKTAIEEAQRDGCCIAGVVLTSPTYEGVVSDIRVISELVHRYELPLIVDEAHGAHFGFCSGFPDNSVQLGADMVIHSVHKTLFAPTQTALIHWNSECIPEEVLSRYLQIYQSSSPSYPLMAGIAEAAELASLQGSELLERVKRLRGKIESEIADLFYVMICPYTEPGKLLLTVRHCGGLPTVSYDGTERPLTGKLLFTLLSREFHIEPEMASPTGVLCILTMADTDEGAERLVDALQKLAERVGLPAGGSDDAGALFYGGLKAESRMPFYQAYGQMGAPCTLAEAVGRTAADFINVYPPGSPLLVPGEAFTDEAVERISAYLNADFEVQGVADGKVRVLD